MFCGCPCRGLVQSRLLNKAIEIDQVTFFYQFVWLYFRTSKVYRVHAITMLHKKKTKIKLLWKYIYAYVYLGALTERRNKGARRNERSVLVTRGIGEVTYLCMYLLQWICIRRNGCKHLCTFTPHSLLHLFRWRLNDICKTMHFVHSSFDYK